MFTNHKIFMFWGKVCYIISAALLIAALVFNLLPPKSVLADSKGKVYVCKYVGEPETDERLQTGQNPIEVSVNAIPEPVTIGSYFPDKQGRSYVLGFVPMDPEPTKDDCPPPDAPKNASASLTTGVCSWTEETGSLTPVTIDVKHASLTINGVTYITSQTIDLAPGNYLYSWEAETGYTGKGSGTIVILDCKPGKASVLVTPGVCSWTQAKGSQTPVTLDLDHASLKINGITYTTSQTIILAPGNYPYTWTAETGYIGKGSGEVVIKDCKPGKASASVTPGVCSWTDEAGSQTPVEIELNHASLKIDGMTFTASQTIYLAPGSHPYSWKAETGYIGKGSGTVIIRDCTPGTGSASLTVGACSWTQATGSLTPVTFFIDHASLNINDVTYTTSQTISLPPGNYSYSWKAETGYLGKGKGKLVIGDCTPGNADASVTTGTCSWTQAEGALTPVTLNLNHASLTINGVAYTASQAINLAPGIYPYTWTAESGYIGNGSGTVVIGDCTPGSASVSVTSGACGWTREAGSMTPLTLDLEHASLTINGETYTTSQTIDLAPGSYPYTWTADSGYIGNGSGTVVIEDCTPGTADASVTTGVCGWTQVAGSLTPVTLFLNHASLTINSVTYTASQTTDLAPGSYPYSWTADNGYIGNGSGTIVIEDCTPSSGSASVTTGACGWTEAEGSQTPVTLELEHASLTINGINYMASQTIDLPPGSYPYSWTADSGYLGSGDGTVVIEYCTPGNGSADIFFGTCSWTLAEGSLTPVSLDLDHATLKINGVTYTAPQTINLAPGSYPYNWAAETGYLGNGSGSIVIGNCPPGEAKASLTAGTCGWTPAEGSLTPVSIELNHALLKINGTTYTASQTIALAPGSYSSSWTAESGYLGNGSETVVIKDCTPSTASASVTTGACGWSQTDGSLTPVTLDLSHASLTINGVVYTASQTINLAPGSYPYSWTADIGSIGNGSGTVVIGDCTPGTASVSVTSGSCKWTQADGSLTSLTIDLNHASLTINGVTYIISETVDLAPGSYPYNWAALSGYTGSGDGTIIIGDCTPGKANASVTPGVCSWTQAAGSLTPVTLDLNHAGLTINGITYIMSQTIALAPGSYPFSWTAETGYIGNGSGTVVTKDCTQDNANASVIPGVCTWTEAAGSLTSVLIELKHASLKINGMTYTTSQSINLKPGSYPYNWTAIDGYTGSVSGTVIIGDCPPTLMPVSGVDRGLLKRILPGSFFGLSLSFTGLGTIFISLARRRKADSGSRNRDGNQRVN